MWMLTACATLGLAMALAPVTQAQTPDGETPAEETVCDGVADGAAWGLCNAYCEAMDCDGTPKASDQACQHVLENFRAQDSGPIPCGSPPSVVTEQPFACQPTLIGWPCIVVSVDAHPHQDAAILEIRWNLPDAWPRASVVWMMGGNITSFLRDHGGESAARAQDELEGDDIRTVEIRYLGDGLREPGVSGFPDAARGLVAVLEWLWFERITEGVVLYHGQSSGATLGAAALAHHRAERWLDGAVFGGGPFWTDLAVSCESPSLLHRAIIDSFNWPWRTSCVDQDLPDALYAEQSTLAPGTDTDYRIPVVVLVGAHDASSWIPGEARRYVDSIDAPSVLFERPDSRHLVVGTEDGAQAVRWHILNLTLTALYDLAPRSHRGGHEAICSGSIPGLDRRASAAVRRRKASVR
jgi:hypothetical protein